ncbi:DNA primase [Treponema parvum]|uniref:DNA primase n=1 Tax=Treponema parvum TaxID=138851 RepID=A0A975F014_9SPIR|nr:DNA primase [Treponema parvum]QTQ11883.1 DNA primase [Treponema parvum]
MPGLISKETIDAIRNSSDIVAIINEYTHLERRGNDWWGCCPFHNEKTPSFHVEPEKNFYYCFGCHASGDAINFIKEMEKVSYVEAVKILAKKAGVEIVYSAGNSEHDKTEEKRTQYIELYERIASTFHYLLTETEYGKQALSYITERGLTKDTIEKFKLGYAPSDRQWLKNFLRKKNFSDEFLGDSGLFSKKYPDIAFFSDRLMFPIFNRQGQAVAFGGRLLSGEGPKYLNSGDLIQYKKGDTLYAFNFAKNSIREKKAVIFCEGYMDVIAYHQCGIDNAVAPLGTALTESQIRMIGGFADTVLLSFDSDAAGQAATVKAILMCRKAGLQTKIIRLSGGKDPAEIMLNYGKETLTQDVNNAILDSTFLLSKLGKDYPVDTADGKLRAALAFFPYVDALRSDIQKESCLEQLSQTFNLNPEAVRRDFNDREQARERIDSRQPDMQDSDRKIKINSELRVLMAVIADLKQYESLRNELSVDDFEDQSAKKIFIALEECYRAEDLSFLNVLSHCDDKELQKLVTEVIEAKEFSNNENKIVQDGIRLIKRKKLEKQRDKLMNRIRQFSPVTVQDKELLQELLSEKMIIDQKLKSK